MLERFFGKNKDLALVIGMILILITLFSPIPPMVLDLAIIVNFGFGLTILLLTFYVAKPVDFSTFPSLLLIATLFRLSLNVAATRLILTGGEAGQVIDSIGSFAVGGFFVVGLVVFFILVVVQYVVVTSGAQRVSEVAARFMLDSMPGQQMSIDADLNMGLIDQDEARARRAELEKEASFYGAMDGASKFVKGDAIAGIIIVLIDIIAGWIIGVAQMGMEWNEALERFTLLTIGDGIATQLPALIISIATGIIVTRSSSDRDLSTEVLTQLSSIPRIPIIVTGILAVLLLLPGMPKWPILILMGLTVLIWFQIRRRARAEPELDLGDDELAGSTTNAGAIPVLSVGFGSVLSDAWKGEEAVIMDRITTLRETHEHAFGIGFPAVKIVDGNKLGSHEYEICLFGTRYAGGEIEPDQMLAIETKDVLTPINGIETKDPTYGLKAVWVETTRADQAQEAGYTVIDPLTVFITHLGELMRNEAPTLMTRAAASGLLEEVRTRQAGLIEELIPTLLSVSDAQRLFQNLLAEGVPISNVDLIAEHLVDLARQEKDIGALTEMIRQRMAYTICNKLKDRNRDLTVLSLDPRIENQVLQAVTASGRPDKLSVDPKLAEHLIRKLSAMADEMVQKGRNPVLLCGPDVRRQLRTLTARAIPRLAILSVNEIPMNIELSSHGIVKLDPGDAPALSAPAAPPAGGNKGGAGTGGDVPGGAFGGAG